MATAFYLLIRSILWLAGVGIAFFPTLQTVHVIDATSATAIAEAINSTGHFRDMFFVIVPASALSLSTVSEFLCSLGSHRASELTRMAVILAFIVNVIILVSGFVAFFLIPPHDHPLDAASFSLWYRVIWIGLLLSYLTETAVSWAHKNHRRPKKRKSKREQKT